MVCETSFRMAEGFMSPSCWPQIQLLFRLTWQLKTLKLSNITSWVLFFHGSDISNDKDFTTLTAEISECSNFAKTRVTNTSGQTIGTLTPGWSNLLESGKKSYYYKLCIIWTGHRNPRWHPFTWMRITCQVHKPNTFSPLMLCLDILLKLFR